VKQKRLQSAPNLLRKIRRLVPLLACSSRKSLTGALARAGKRQGCVPWVVVTKMHENFGNRSKTAFVVVLVGCHLYQANINSPKRLSLLGECEYWFVEVI
jgi:hypothetical protein